MRVLRCLRAIGALLPACAPPLAAQGWDAPEAVALVRRAVDQRVAVQADSILLSYRTRAHGFVFFLAQVGEGLTEPPRLIKADELDVEVYWQAPNHSKQVVLGWRDGAFLPTDIEYHRDHLGIVTNNFGDLIRIGEGDEVRDVPHPLSPAGLALYDFALTDSVSVQGATGQVKLRAVAVRPKDFSRPAAVGTLYLDAATSQLVRFRFSFTPASYLDRQLEDITITLQSSLWEERYWLPYRQEVELRRRFSWLDFPARGIIRGRWEIEDYDLNPALPEGLFTGPAIAGLRRPGGPDSLFSEPFNTAVVGAGPPLDDQDMTEVRTEIERLAEHRSLSGLPATRFGGGGLSDFIRVNRVQGLALGASSVFGVRGSRIEVRPFVGIGTSDGRATGGAELTIGDAGTRLVAFAGRRVRDFSDFAIVSPALNSITSQEFGDDYGDYVLTDAGFGGLRQRIGSRLSVALEAGAERSRSLDVESSPANGTYRPNPPLGAGTYGVARIRLERGSGGSVATTGDLQGLVQLEGGSGPGEYLRATAQGRWFRNLGTTSLAGRVLAGVGTEETPPHRGFAIGGRGTLPGERFREFGGRRFAFAHVEWRFAAPFPAIPLGSFATTGRTVTLAPFVAAGWAGGTLGPWDPDGGVRPVAGLAAELLMRIVRVEAGVALRTGEFGITVDVSREWWGAL